MAKSSTIGGLEFLSKSTQPVAAALCVVYGDEAFLKREILKAIRRQVLGDDDSEFALSAFSGPTAQLRDVLDGLATASLFGSGRRLVIVEEADSFVTQHRAELEDYAAKPAAGGVLMLEVTSWPSNTRLAKAVAASGVAVDC